jgi:hypothetical protein
MSLEREGETSVLSNAEVFTATPYITPKHKKKRLSCGQRGSSWPYLSYFCGGGTRATTSFKMAG